jgi:hypothetical protein
MRLWLTIASCRAKQKVLKKPAPALGMVATKAVEAKKAAESKKATNEAAASRRETDEAASDVTMSHVEAVAAKKAVEADVSKQAPEADTA